MKPKTYLILIPLIITFLIASPPVYAQGLPQTPKGAADKARSGIEGKVTMDFENATLKDVLKAFSKQTGVNFISSDVIEGKVITVYLNNISIDEALSAILDANGLSYEKQPGNVYLVKPSGAEKIRTVTKVFRLNYLQVYKMHIQEGTSTSISGVTIIQPAIPAGGGAPPIPSTTPAGGGESAEESKPKTIIDIIKSLMSKQGKIVGDRRNNSLIVTDIPEVFDSIEKTIKELDTEPIQIMIQAEIIETTTTALKRIGIEYGGGTAESASLLNVLYGKSTSAATSQNTVIPTSFPFTNPLIKELFSTATTPGTSAFGGLWKYGTLTIENTNIVLKLIAQDDDTKYLSRPRIMTINNEPAIIKASANTAIGVTSSIVGTAVSQTISTAERVETGVILKVTPQVNNKGDIFMYVEPSISRAKASTFFTTQFMDPSYRTSASTVMVREGSTIVIGGLIQNDNFRTIRKVPILGDIPILGEPFKSRYKKLEDTELLIFITPHIVKRRDTEYIIPKELTEREHMLERTLDEYSKKRPKAAQEPKASPKKSKSGRYDVPQEVSAGREEALQETLEKYSKK